MRANLLMRATCLFLFVLFPLMSNAGQTQTIGPPEEKVSSVYKEPAKDPFRGEIAIKPTVIHPPEAAAWPTYEEREFEWKKRREEARKKGLSDPAPSERYLIDELKVVGIIKKPEGSIAVLKPKPVAGTTIFAGAGQKFYNGSIRRIEDGKIEFEELTKMSDKTVRADRREIRFTHGN